MNRFTKQRVLSLLMTGSLMLGMSPSVLAIDGYNGVKDIPGVGNSEVTLTVENTGGGGTDPDNPDIPPVDPDPVIFSAYVPAELPIKMDLDGNITVPTDAMIINAVETKGICVTDVNVIMENGWSPSNWNADFATKSDSKELGLKLRSDYLSSDGSFSLTSDDWKICKNSYIPLEMGAKLPKQTESGNKGKVATVSFTLDWSGDDVTVGPEIPGGNPNGGSSGGGSETPDNPPDVSTLTVDWENGLLLPGSKKTATINWDSTNQNDKIITLTSSNEDIAVVPDLSSIPTPMSETTSYKGSLPVEVTAVARGTSTITVTLESGATNTFDVQVADIDTNSGSEPSGEVKPDSSFNEGDTLKPGDITVTIPVVKPDGSTENIIVTPNTVPDTPLVEGENNIEVTVDVNGVTVKIHITINIASSNPSNGMQQSVVDAQAMGLTFTPYSDGLEITGFENKQFKSEINVPEQIGDFKVLSIGESAFKNQTNIKRITLPDTITNIGNYGFQGCTNLEDIVISKNLSGIGHSAFLNCSRLISHINIKNVKNIGSSAFEGCAAVTLEISTNKLTSIGENPFDNIKEVKVEIADLNFKKMNADLLYTFATAIPSGSKVILYDNINEEVIPLETINKDRIDKTYKLYQDYNYNFVNIQMVEPYPMADAYPTLKPISENNVYMPLYSNGMEKSAMDILNTLRIDSEAKVYIGSGMLISTNIHTPAYPVEIFIDSTYSEYTYKDSDCFFYSMVHYKDKTMMYGKDVTGYTLNRVRIDDVENRSSYDDHANNGIFTLKNIPENLSSVKFYFTNKPKSFVLTNLKWIEVPYANGFKIVKNSSAYRDQYAENWLIFYYIDNTNKIISLSSTIRIGWEYAKNGVILNNIVIPT